mmetsp:Transcript_34175/g.76964  ORF Transcript_34175/g.76964 Transcript_34175/m.76964 type:complete len:92 (+) Transcript_34175:1799-2074(+)
MSLRIRESSSRASEIVLISSQLSDLSFKIFFIRVAISWSGPSDPLMIPAPREAYDAGVVRSNRVQFYPIESTFYYSHRCRNMLAPLHKPDT